MAARCFVLGVVGIGPCDEHGWHMAAHHLLFMQRAKLAYGRSFCFSLLVVGIWPCDEHGWHMAARLCDEQCWHMAARAVFS